MKMYHINIKNALWEIRNLDSYHSFLLNRDIVEIYSEAITYKDMRLLGNFCLCLDKQVAAKLVFTKVLENEASQYSMSIFKTQMAIAETPDALFITKSHNSFNDVIVLQAWVIICEYLSVVT